MPIPNAHAALVTAEKVRNYLLSPEHPDGRSKAAWFQSLGYSRSQWRVLAADLLAIARGCKKYTAERTRFGVKYVASGEVGHPSRGIGRVLPVWIIEGDGPPRLVTAYPDEEP